MRCMRFSGAKRTRASSARGSARTTSGGCKTTTAGSSNKEQPSDCPNPHPHTLPTPTPPLTRHQHQLQQQRNHTHPPAGGSTSGGGGLLLSSVGPKPSQSEGKMPGRHPHPPSGNNSKLKHKCPFDGCPWKFATPYKLRRHIKSHTKETPFVCKECGRGFSVRYNLLMHIQTIHSQPQRFKCPMPGCKEAFHTQPRLNGHLRRVHKKDWKTMQLPKPEPEGKQGSNGGSRSSSTSSTSSDDSVDTTPKAQRFECVQCSTVFSSEAKLNTHLKSHANEKLFKCTMQGCNKVFPAKDKLAKHLEIHKQQPKQFCCPHENCNRVFLRQSHLKNHLKIHAHNYFVCPVMDCNEKFASEADYNVHINTHMNYRHKCGVAGCGHAFLTRKRLELHCRVMHGLELHGHQSLLPVSLGHGAPLVPPHSQHHHHPHHHQHSPPPHHSPILTATAAPCPPLVHGTFLDVEEGIREVDLPGLSPDEIETILSENSHWSSGEQFKNFFHSAVELSEMEAKLFSGSGYESDSGYSTYDVSPITSQAPLQFGGCRPEVSTGYRSISPALTPVNPSPFISLSSSNPFQFGTTNGSMHLSLHSSGGGHTPTTPLPHSAASTDGEFAFFPPSTPSYHHQSLPTAPAVTSPTQEPFMIPHGGFPHMTAPPQQQQQREFHMPPYPTAPLMPHDLRQQQQQQQQQQQPESYGIDFPDILDETQTGENPVVTTRCSGEVLRRQQVLPPPLLPMQGDAAAGEIKVEVEQRNCCSNSSETSPCFLASSPTQPLPASSVKQEAGPEGNTMPPPCKMSPTASKSNDKRLQSFLDTCAKLPCLNELATSDLHPSVVVVAVSTALEAASQSNHQFSCSEMIVKQGPYDISRLHSLVSGLTPHQLERLSNPEVISTARRLAAQHLEGLAAARRSQKERQASGAASKAKKTAGGSSGIVVQSNTSVKTSIYVKHRSSGGGVGRVGAGSDMKSGAHKKKTQWPRSMNKANLMAFREHILNKLKRGQEGQRLLQSVNLTSQPSGVASPAFEIDLVCGADIDGPAQVRCSSEPADFFSQQHSELSPSHLHTTHSAGNVSLKHFDSVSYGSPETLHEDLNPDILLSSSVLGLPDSLLEDMEIDSLASSLSSPAAEHDFVQFLCDPSPPTSVTSPLDSMQDLDSIQDLLSDDNISGTGDFTDVTPSSASSTGAPPSFSPVPSPTCTTPSLPTHQSSLQEPSPFPTTTSSSPSCPQPAAVDTVCSMADMASLFNESINSIASVESVPHTTQAPTTLEDSLESVFQRPADPLLACGSRYALVNTSRPF